MTSTVSDEGSALPPAWIEVIHETDADEAIAAAYAACADSATGKVAHIMKVHSLHPQSMLDHRALYETLLFGRSPLKRYQREMIGTVVSAANGCRY
jgi:alkylhydroperoxidase family enzyme